MNYNLNYTNLTNNNIPPNHRLSVIQALFACFTKPLQWLHDWFFGKRVGGLDYASYDETATYAINDYVYNFWIDTSGTPIIKGDMCVYICIKPTTAGIECDNAVYFYKINDSIFGLDKYNYLNAQSILFEYALNKAFNTVALPLAYKQPSTGDRSDIYIENLETNVPLYVGIDSQESGYVVFNSYEANQYVYVDSAPPETTSYIIYVPINLSDAINASGTTTFKIISQIANKFNLSGFEYKIVTY